MTSRELGLTNQINLKVDAPEGVLPTQEHTIKGKSGKKLLDVELSEDVSPTWAEMEKVSLHTCNAAFDLNSYLSSSTRASSRTLVSPTSTFSEPESSSSSPRSSPLPVSHLIVV
jgi:hypothetical protein